MTATISRDRVLIVEDDPTTRLGLTELVRTWGFATEAAADGEEALQRITSFRPSIIITDLVMPRMGGLELLRALKEEAGDVTMVMLTAQGTVETAVEAIKEGAYDYLTKPVDPQRLKILLDKIVERQDTSARSRCCGGSCASTARFGRMIGNSPEMRKVYQVIEQAAPTAASVLICGESGTGKELVAQTDPPAQPRAQMPFVADQLRGDSGDAARERDLRPREGRIHRRGRSPRGLLRAGRPRHAVPRRDRRDDAATQVKLLRVLQERTFRRLGGRDEQTVDVRVIAATNIDPLEAVKKGKLREDLYYRLNVFAIELPPLRERKDDLPLLIQAFIDEFNTRNNRSRCRRRARRRCAMLEQYNWPGNVRELRNVIERATILAARRVHRAEASAAARDQQPRLRRSPPSRWSPGMTVEEAERRLILMTLGAHARQQDARGGNPGHQPEDAAQQAQSAAGKKLGEARGPGPERR